MNTQNEQTNAALDAGHTPGLWRYGSASDEVLTKEGTPICAMDVSRDQMPAEMTEANARLIAAAPDLLAALEETLEAIALVTPDAPEPVNGSVIHQARAAIAKAKGVKS